MHCSNLMNGILQYMFIILLDLLHGILRHRGIFEVGLMTMHFLVLV